jgi:hypothetical protein
MKKFVVNYNLISEDKIAVCEKTAGQIKERELFGLELSVFESVNSRKNISVPCKTWEMKVNDIGTQQTAYAANWHFLI